MKKTVISILMMLFFLVVVACGSENDNSSNDEGSSDDYPDENMKIIVPFNAGGGADTVMRQFAPYLEDELGVNLNVENRPGAGTLVANNSFITEKNQGYEVLNFHQPHTSFTIHTQDANYSLDDFSLINFHVSDPGGMVVLNDSGMEDFSDFVDKIEKNPGEVAIGAVQSSGPHILLYWLQDNTDLDFKIVPYEGGSPSRKALLGEEIDGFFSYAAATLDVKDQMKVIGVTTDERHDTWPDAPTFSETLDLDVPNVGSLRGLAFPKEFQEEYPERFDKFKNMYKEAFENKEYQKENANTGLHFGSQEENEKMMHDMDELVEEYQEYFE